MESHFRRCRPRRLHRGFAYLLLLVAVAVLGVVSASAVSIGAHAARRDAETHLLAIGAEFENALSSYRAMPGGAISTGPRSLEDLLQDPRRPTITRHLRQVYADPLTGRSEWGLVKEPDGSITGIYSLAAGEPIKRSGFDEPHAAFSNVPTYANWVFTGAMPRRSVPAVPQISTK